MAVSNGRSSRNGYQQQPDLVVLDLSIPEWHETETKAIRKGYSFSTRQFSGALRVLGGSSSSGRPHHFPIAQRAQLVRNTRLQPGGHAQFYNLSRPTQRAEGGSAEVPGFAIHDPSLLAYDKTTGKVVGEVALPRNATAAPMTYLLNGEQYIVVVTGGTNLPAELIALRLPAKKQMDRGPGASASP